MTIHRPLRHETIVVLLDDQRRGLAIAVVTGTRRPDDVVEVVECLARPSVRDEAGRRACSSPACDPTGAPIRRSAADVDRWLELSDLAEQAGVELLEWFVIDPHAVTCPRDLLGEPPRW